MAVEAAISLFLLQTIWVVDDGGGPGVNFNDIPPAVAAAADGDILLVQPGTYSHFTLSGKGLRILGSGQANTLVSNPGANSWRSTISGIPAGSIAYVDRMNFDGDPLQGPRLTVSGSGTTAVLADVVLVGPQSTSLSFTCSFFCRGLRVEGATLHAIRANLSGWFGGCPGTCVGGGGVPMDVSSGAKVHVATSTLLGGFG
jgi:hypothetical protein